jgi:hypothetical protein
MAPSISGLEEAKEAISEAVYVFPLAERVTDCTSITHVTSAITPFCNEILTIVSISSDEAVAQHLKPPKKTIMRKIIVTLESSKTCFITSHTDIEIT